MQDHDPPLHRPPAGRQSWLVTGASAGVGLAICRALHEAGHELTGFGRKQAQDLSADFPDIAGRSGDGAGLRAAGRARACVSGYGAAECRYWPLPPALPRTPQAISDLLALNLLMPMLTAQLLFGALLARGKVLGLVGSVAYRGAVMMQVYAARKVGLDGFGWSLRSEWQGRMRRRVSFGAVIRQKIMGRAPCTTWLHRPQTCHRHAQRDRAARALGLADQGYQ